MREWTKIYLSVVSNTVITSTPNARLKYHYRTTASGFVVIVTIATGLSYASTREYTLNLLFVNAIWCEKVQVKTEHKTVLIFFTCGERGEIGLQDVKRRTIQPLKSMLFLTSAQWLIEHDTEAHVPYFFEQCLFSRRKPPDLKPSYIIASPLKCVNFQKKAFETYVYNLMLIYLNCKLRTFTLKHLSYLRALSPPYRVRFKSRLNS